MTKRILVYIFIVFLVSCCTPSYRDVSGSAEYVHLIGREFRTLDEMLIFGYSRDNNFETLDGYVITTKPGIGGREILTREVFPVGSILLIERIMECSNCILAGKRIVVKVISNEAYSGTPVKLREKANTFVSRSEGTAVEMNPQLFELVPD